MTLPASYPITMAQIATELGLPFPLSLSHSFILSLAGKSAVPVSMSDLLGKTGSARFTIQNSYSVSQGSTLVFPFGSNVMLWGGTLNEIFQDPSNNITVAFSGGASPPPTWNGKFKFTDESTGASAVLTKQNGTTWGGVGTVIPTSNVTHTYSLFPQ